MWSCDQSLQFYERSYRKLFSEFDQKNTFFEGWSWFKFNNLGLALGIALEFYTGLAKGLKLKVRKLWGVILMFVEVTGEKLVGEPEEG